LPGYRLSEILASFGITPLQLLTIVQFASQWTFTT